MIKLLPIFAFSLIMSWLSQLFTKYELKINEYGRHEYKKKEYLFYTILTVFLILFIGLRTNYNDTSTYVYAYEHNYSSGMSIIDSFNKQDWIKIGLNPGYEFLMNILKHYGVSSQGMLMFFAVFTVPVYVWFIRKYTNNLVFSMFLFFVVGSYLFCLAGIKQTFAMAILLIGTDREIRKKHISFVVLVLLACTIHAYSWLYFIVPFMRFKPWSVRTYISLVIFGIIGVSIAFNLGGLLSITGIIGDEYTVEEMSGNGVNIFRLGVTLVPTVLSLILKDKIEESRYDDINCIMVNLSILHAELMFIALFGAANYFARLANYFQMFAIISIPWLLQFVGNKYKKVLIIASVILYLIYFYYGNVYANIRPFDEEYSKIPISEFKWF